jgi:hypothetical protein
MSKIGEVVGENENYFRMKTNFEKRDASLARNAFLV